MWYVLFVVGVLLYLYPQLLLLALFQSAKFSIYVWSVSVHVWSTVKLWWRRVKRQFHLKTSKFDDRPVMQRPSLSTGIKKRF